MCTESEDRFSVTTLENYTKFVGFTNEQTKNCTVEELRRKFNTIQRTYIELQRIREIRISFEERIYRINWFNARSVKRHVAFSDRSDAYLNVPTTVNFVLHRFPFNFIGFDTRREVMPLAFECLLTSYETLRTRLPCNQIRNDNVSREDNVHHGTTVERVMKIRNDRTAGFSLAVDRPIIRSTNEERVQFNEKNISSMKRNANTFVANQLVTSS